MWVFLNDAMVSMVADRNRPGWLVVRARLAGDLERLFGERPVEHTPAADYAWRCSVPARHVADVIAQRVVGVDYGNFKGSVDGGDDARHEAYFDVWQAMQQAQHSEAWRLMRRAGQDGADATVADHG